LIVSIKLRREAALTADRTWYGSARRDGSLSNVRQFVMRGIVGTGNVPPSRISWQSDILITLTEKFQ
jgi:hypothetical protein